MKYTTVRVRIVRALLLAVLLTLAVTVSAQQEPFTSGELDRFIRDWPEFIAWSEARGEAIQAEDFSDFSSVYTYTSDMEQFLEQRGWSADRFFYVATQTSTGLMALELSAQMPGMIQELERQRDQIRETPYFTPEQKDEMIAGLDEAIAQWSQVEFGDKMPASEMQLISARRDELRAAFEWE